MSTAKFKTIGDVAGIVKKANLNDASASEIKASKAIYSPKVIEIQGVHLLFLVDQANDKHRYRITPLQLAALRVSAGNNTAEYSNEFLQDASKGWRFQRAWEEMEALGIGLGDINMVCYHQVKLRNYQAPGGVVVPLYKDFCYSGIDKFREKVDALGYDWSVENSDEVVKAYYANRRKFRNELHRTPLFDGFGIDANLDTVPAFTVSK